MLDIPTSKSTQKVNLSSEPYDGSSTNSYIIKERGNVQKQKNTAIKSIRLYYKNKVALKETGIIGLICLR